MNAVALVLWLILGSIVGAWLNVVICRVPRGESIRGRPSHCSCCGRRCRVGDSVPILRWLVLGGRCRDCAGSFSLRYPAATGLTAALFAAMAWRFGANWELPAYLYLAAIGVALSLIDLETKRLPDVITLRSYPALALLFLLPAAIDAQWSAYLRAWVGAAALFGFYFVAILVNSGGIGGGDVKLAGLLGMATGWLGWAVLVVGGLLGHLFAIVCAGALIAIKRISVKTTIPFGPFMIAGAILAVLVGRPGSLGP